MTKLVTTQSQQKWECCLESRRTETSLVIESNRLGQEGWELVSVLFYKDVKGVMCWTAFYKRPSASQEPPAVDGQPRAEARPAAQPARTAPAPQAGFDLSDADFEIKSDG